jgi:hypothetical protein
MLVFDPTVKVGNDGVVTVSGACAHADLVVAGISTMHNATNRANFPLIVASLY